MMKLKVLGVCLYMLYFCCITIGCPRVFANEREDLLRAGAVSAYNSWKQNYVVPAGSFKRVVNPQDDFTTVSEAMGYGLLFSVAMDDELTFKELWQYAKGYINNKGLMDWKINRWGNVIGKGSAADADQDIAYALLLAHQKWPQENYLADAKRMLQAIKKYEINETGLLLPGDSWRGMPPINPSYIALGYYKNFEAASGDPIWAKVLKKNRWFLYQIADRDTGLIPDWVAQDQKIIKGQNDFGYDAVRCPLRLYSFYSQTGDPLAEILLKKQAKFIKSIGLENLVAGYTLDGMPKVSYINAVYLAAFLSVSNMDADEEFSLNMVKKLVSFPAADYYGSSLKVWAIFISSHIL